MIESLSSAVPVSALHNASSLEDINIIGSEKRSLYVETFQNIQDVVMKHESFLFSVEEQAIFAKFNSLSYNAQYLFIRLCLCKRGKWHTLSSLEQRYIKELGDKQSILQAIDELCGKCNSSNPKQENNKATIIDLTLIDDGQDVPASIIEPPSTKDSSILAEDDTIASLEELLESLTASTLKELAKNLSILNPRKTRLELIRAILTQSRNQSTLTFPALDEHEKGKITVESHSIKLNGSKITQAEVVRLQVLKVLGRCIRIPISVLLVIDRLNILFFRSTEYNSSLFLPALLSSFKKRNHAPVEYSRTPDIFPDRQTLVNYQDALVLESNLEDALTLEGPSPYSRSERAKMIRGTWEDAYSQWKDLVNLNHDKKIRNPLIYRYHPGHILTRIVHRGLDILSALKDYTTEIEVLKALLGQTIWGTGRRGAWYDRLALILMTYFGDSIQSLEESLDVVMSALEDENTHIIYRPRLQRRLARLESKLKIPLTNRHQCIRKLKDAENVYIEGVRLRDSEQFNASSLKTWFPNSNSQTTSSLSTKGKTLWVGNDGLGISVEQFALQYYSTLDYQGLHSEGRVIATLFGLLFWDIIFSRIPGAFETPFQSAPLDILDATFYTARKESIEKRLQTLRNGGGEEILERVISREGAQRTMCIGVDWEFKSKDLLNIVKYLRGDVIATICQMVAEDYGRWRAGLPDLLIWNSNVQECKFVEVKSANDTLQENQKVWIDILLSAGATVELCHVLEAGSRLTATSRKRTKSHDIDGDGDLVVHKKGKKRED